MDKTVNILSFVSYKFLPPDMGGQKGIAFFNRYLSRQTNLTCVTIKDNSQAAAEGYPIKNILSNSSTRYINPFYFFTLSRIIREEKITHLIIEHPYYGWLGILLKWFCKVKLIVHSHNIESYRFKSTGKWWWGILWHYEKLVHKKADHNFFIQDNDRNYAIENFKLDPQRCTVITYGFELSKPPAAADKRSAREQICQTHGISGAEKILLFNGTLGYKPNLDALDIILEKINPLLLADEVFSYKIIICGNKLPAEYSGLINYREKNIIYAGFVDDINLYFKGCDIFINPVIDGGGIKTKVVEALGYDLSVISTESGAIGIPVEITGDKLKVLPDDDWNDFARQVILHDPGNMIPPTYFAHFYWGNIAAKAAGIINYLE
jgi:polysaccharide biosynthesis protein PslH